MHAANCFVTGMNKIFLILSSIFCEDYLIEIGLLSRIEISSFYKILSSIISIELSSRLQVR